MNQFLQEKFGELKKSEELQRQNVVLCLQIKELQATCSKMQMDSEERILSKQIMVDKATNTEASTSVGPSTMIVPYPLVHVPGPAPLLVVSLVTPVPKLLPTEICSKLWAVECKIALRLNLHQLYEIHRDLLLVMTGLELGTMFDLEQFRSLWDFCGSYRVENLLVEVLARKHLKLIDSLGAFVIMGDMGGRIYLYYANCEEQLQSRRGLGMQVKER